MDNHNFANQAQITSQITRTNMGARRTNIKKLDGKDLEMVAFQQGKNWVGIYSMISVLSLICLIILTALKGSNGWDGWNVGILWGVLVCDVITLAGGGLVALGVSRKNIGHVKFGLVTVWVSWLLSLPLLYWALYNLITWLKDSGRLKDILWYPIPVIVILNLLMLMLHIYFTYVVIIYIKSTKKKPETTQPLVSLEGVNYPRRQGGPDEPQGQQQLRTQPPNRRFSDPDAELLQDFGFQDRPRPPPPRQGIRNPQPFQPAGPPPPRQGIQNPYPFQQTRQNA